jgi:hypothetical protein
MEPIRTRLQKSSAKGSQVGEGAFGDEQEREAVGEADLIPCLPIIRVHGTHRLVR